MQVQRIVKRDARPEPAEDDEAGYLAELIDELYLADGTPNRLTLHRLRYISVEYTPEQSAAISAAFDLDARMMPPAEWKRLYPQVDREIFLATGRRVNPDTGQVYGDE